MKLEITKEEKEILQTVLSEKMIELFKEYRETTSQFKDGGETIVIKDTDDAKNYVHATEKFKNQYGTLHNILLKLEYDSLKTDV